MGQVFNKGLNVDEKHKGLLKRLKNIEDKTDNQLDLIPKTKDTMFICHSSKRMKKLRERVNRENKENEIEIKNKEITLAAVMRDDMMIDIILKNMVDRLTLETICLIVNYHQKKQ